MAATVVVAMLVVALGAGQAGLLAGNPPADLGVTGGKLKAPSTTPNSVSSQAGLWAGHPQQVMSGIAPLPLRGTPAEAITRLRAVVQAMPGAEVVTQRDDYLYVRFSTRWLGFVDDAEFWADPARQVIQVRSASRLGASDLGLNRTRIERIRTALQ
ncbi:MAG: DUF1499 domain-containing protein [Aquabacterium sp.]|nr:DUF1499 domain-containing protein [Aquabacterium sp.]